jgi:hypothetical protein
VCGSATSSRGDVGDSQGRFYLVLRYTALHPDFEVPVKLLFVLLLAACGDTTSAPGSSSALQGPVALINPAASVAPIAAAEPIPVAAPVGQPATMSMSDLTDMSKADLRVARNEIFARHGRGFSSEDLQAHFGGQDWYHVNADYSDDMLSDAQKAQVALTCRSQTLRLSLSATSERFTRARHPRLTTLRMATGFGPGRAAFPWRRMLVISLGLN